MTSIDSDSRTERSGRSDEAEWRRGSELSRSLAAAAARVDELIGNAQSIAEQIYRDAERDAERLLAERRGEAERLLSEQRALIKDVFETLRRDLDAAERRAGDAVDAGRRRIAAPEVPPAPGSPRPLEAVEQADVVAYPGAAVNAPPQDGGVNAPPQDGGERRQDRARALVRAGQLAAMGQDRAQIEAALRHELGVERPGEVVDEILRG